VAARPEKKGSFSMTPDERQRWQEQVEALQAELKSTQRTLHSLQYKLETQLSEKSQELERIRKSDSYHQLQSRKLFWALEQASDGVLLTDLMGEIEFANRAFLEMHGYTLKELEGGSVSMLSAIESETLETTERKQWEETAHEEETLQRRKDNSVFPAWSRTSLLQDNHGVLIGAVTILRDITDRKQQERELNESREAAEAASVAKSEFLSHMSHEIRTPLNTIIGMTQLTLETSLNEDQQEYLRSVNVSSQALLELINDLLDFSKIEAGRMELEPVPFDLSELMQSVVDILKLRAEMKGLEFHCVLDPYLPPFLMGDPLRLRQILLNLAGNAVKFTQAGSVQIQLDVLGQQVQTQSQEVLYDLLFRVVDTGQGISEEDQQRIFEDYAQAQQPRYLREKGTGLGLSICRTLVQMMEGALEVESEVGRGTTFFVRLQLPGLEKEHVRQHYLSSGGYVISDAFLALQSSLQGGSRRKTKLLLVEDNPDNQRIAQLFLQKAGLQVEVANHGQEAVERFQHEFFDLVFMDLEMPVMNGFDAVLTIRQLEKDSLRTPAPILTLTAHTDTETRQRCLEVGMDDFLIKPLQKSRMLSMVKRWQDRRHLLLVADDNFDNRRLLYFYLKQSERFKLVFAQNGQEAVEWFVSSQPALVLMDLEMPVMDGLTAMKTIRRMAGGQQVPILALSAHQADATQRQCLEEGFSAYLQKPLRKRALLDTLDRYLPE
jgi:PAS domain S-box-containing protein